MEKRSLITELISRKFSKEEIRNILSSSTMSSNEKQALLTFQILDDEEIEYILNDKNTTRNDLYSLVIHQKLIPFLHVDKYRKLLESSLSSFSSSSVDSYQGITNTYSCKTIREIGYECYEDYFIGYVRIPYLESSTIIESQGLYFKYDVIENLSGMSIYQYIPPFKGSVIRVKFGYDNIIDDSFLNNPVISPNTEWEKLELIKDGKTFKRLL